MVVTGWRYRGRDWSLTTKECDFAFCLFCLQQKDYPGKNETVPLPHIYVKVCLETCSQHWSSVVLDVPQTQWEIISHLKIFWSPTKNTKQREEKQRPRDGRTWQQLDESMEELETEPCLLSFWSALTSNSCLSLESGNWYATNLLLATLYVLLLPERLCKITLLSWRYKRKIKKKNRLCGKLLVHILEQSSYSEQENF